MLMKGELGKREFKAIERHSAGRTNNRISLLRTRGPWFAPGLVHVGFVVELLALGQIFLRVFLSSPVSIIPPWLSPYSYIILEMNKRPFFGRSSETWSHPLQMNNFY
jgi:hypothetical protein